MYKWILFVGAIAFGQSAVANESPQRAADGDSATSASLAPEAEGQLREELRKLVARLAQTGVLGPHPDQIALDVDEPAQRVNDLGLLVDSTNAERARDGLRVIGTTPGGIADKLGIRAGDTILAVNGTALRALGADADGHLLATRTLKSIIDDLKDGATLRILMQRAGTSVELRMPMQSVKVPAFHFQIAGSPPGETFATNSTDAPTGCGRVSMFDVAPRFDQVYRVHILQIDGVTPGPRGQQSFRVGAGPHRLLIAEQIPASQLSGGDAAQLHRYPSKLLDVDVKPGTTLLIGAQLHRDAMKDLSTGAYWDPVVWKTIDERCP